MSIIGLIGAVLLVIVGMFLFLVLIYVLTKRRADDHFPLRHPFHDDITTVH